MQRITIDITDREAAILGDALNLHRTHLKSPNSGWASTTAWLDDQDSLERKLREGGLYGVSLDSDYLHRGRS